MLRVECSVRTSCDWGCTVLCEEVGVLSDECCVRNSCDWGCTGFSGISLVDAALRVGDVRNCAGSGFQVCNCLQGGVGDCWACCCVVFEGTLSVQVVVSDERTSCEHAAVPLRFGVLCVSVRSGRSVAPVSF